MTSRSATSVSAAAQRSITRARRRSAIVDELEHPFCHAHDDSLFDCDICGVASEVAGEFAGFNANPWERVEEWWFRKIKRGFAKLAAVRDWQRSTTWGRERERAAQRERDAVAKTRRVSVRCSLCGGPFSVQERNLKRAKSSKRVCLTCRTRNSMGKPITIGGTTKTLTEWAREYGINQSTVYYRIQRGMSVVDALTQPLHRYRGRRQVAA